MHIAPLTTQHRSRQRGGQSLTGLLRLLGLLWVLAQLTAFAHQLGHLQLAGDDSGLPENACVWCVGWAQMAAAAPLAASAFALPVLQVAVLPCLRARPACAPVILGYRSQAPPVFPQD